MSRQRVASVKLERERETAVVAIQKSARGYLSRKRVDSIRENRRMQNEREDAIKTIQANARGYLTRKVTNEKLNRQPNTNRKDIPPKLALSGLDGRATGTSASTGRSAKSNRSNGSKQSLGFVPPPPSSPSQMNKPRLRSRNASRNASRKSTARSDGSNQSSSTAMQFERKPRRSNPGNFLSKELKQEMQASDLELNRANRMLADMRKERAIKEEAYRVLEQGSKEKQELNALREQLQDVNKELKEERRQRGVLIQELQDLKEKLADVDERRQKAEAAVISVDDAMKEREKNTRALEREIEMLKRKVKSAKEDARLEAEIEIERLKTELECRTQLLNMRWKRHEEMMRESYERQAMKASASTGQLPQLYRGGNVPPPGLIQHVAQQQASPVPLMSRTMAYMEDQRPPQHFGQLNSGHDVLTSMTGIPTNYSIPTETEPGTGSAMPPILPLATIGKSKPRIKENVRDSDGTNANISFPNSNKISARSMKSVRSVGGKGSYSLNYQKQKKHRR